MSLADLVNPLSGRKFATWLTTFQWIKLRPEQPEYAVLIDQLMGLCNLPGYNSLSRPSLPDKIIGDHVAVFSDVPGTTTKL